MARSGHSITSSASDNRLSENLIPNALAVFTLTTLSIHLDDVDAVAHETASHRIFPEMVDGGHRIGPRQLGNPTSPGVKNG
jgi:hypothetical protein